MEKLNNYIISLIEERNKIFEKAQKQVSLILTPEIFKANAITHGLNILLDFYEKEGISTDFVPDILKQERDKYKFMLNNFNTPEVQEQIKPIIEKLQHEKKL